MRYTLLNCVIDARLTDVHWLTLAVPSCCDRIISFIHLWRLPAYCHLKMTHFDLPRLKSTTRRLPFSQFAWANTSEKVTCRRTGKHGDDRTSGGTYSVHGGQSSATRRFETGTSCGAGHFGIRRWSGCPSGSSASRRVLCCPGGMIKLWGESSDWLTLWDWADLTRSLKRRQRATIVILCCRVLTDHTEGCRAVLSFGPLLNLLFFRKCPKVHLEL